MPSVDVLIPWRPGCEHRQRAFDWVTIRHAIAGRNILIGEHDTGPWCKAAAVHSALEDSTADILVIHDADVWTDELQRAVDKVAAGAPWAIPHQWVHRLDPAATDELLATGRPGDTLDQEPYVGHPGGGIVVLTRDTYLDCPLDPRFVGWGQEDDAWAHALTTLAGRPWRGAADLIHLWHPPQERRDRHVGSDQGHRLYRRYCAAARKREAMRLLVDEHRKGT